MIAYRNFHYLILLLLLLPLTAFGQGGNQIIDFNTNIKAEKDQLIQEVSFLIQINDRQSDWISNIEIPYDEDDKLEILEASIINAQGVTVRKLKKKEITNRSHISNGTFYEDDLIKEFQLRWNEYPYRIKYRYRKTTAKFIYVARWFPVVYTSVPTLNASLKVELPHDYKANISFSDGLDYQSDTLENTYLHHWSAKMVAPLHKELYTPPFQELIPSVSIVPETFNYGLEGSFGTWAAYGNWQQQINEGLDILPYAEKQKVNSLTEGMDDPKEIVKTLYHYMQDNTRYINVAIDIGGLKPYPAAYVCSNKYGDCKALTIYMKALLRHAGIPSYYTKVYAGSTPARINKNFPSQQFNHVVLSIPLEGDTLWLENTANYLPYNYLGTFTQNRWALLVDGENSRLVKTPSFRLDEVMERDTYYFSLNQEGNGTVQITRDVKGKAFEEYKHAQYELQGNDLKHHIEKNISLNNYKTIKWNIIHPDRDEPGLQMDLALEVKNQFRKIGGMLVINPAPIPLPDLERPDARKTSVRISYPINRSDSLVYELPFIDNYQFEVPEDIGLETEYGRYTTSYARNNQQLTIIRNFQLFEGDYTLEEYSSLYSFIDSIKKSHQKSAVVFNPL